jgi:hypothetical protein
MVRTWARKLTGEMGKANGDLIGSPQGKRKEAGHYSGLN